MRILYLSLTLFLIDQVSKIFVRGMNFPLIGLNHAGLLPGDSKPIINELLHITLVENPGIAFGIDPGEALQDVILIITIITCISFLGFLVYAKKADKSVRVAIALILGGAAGNLFDRIFYGYFYNYAPLFQGNVVDFLDLRMFKVFIFNNIHGNYVFNFADLSILSGVFIMIYFIFTSKTRNREKTIVPQFVEDREENN